MYDDDEEVWIEGYWSPWRQKKLSTKFKTTSTEIVSYISNFQMKKSGLMKSLSFRYKFAENEDKVEFAMCVPYTYSKLIQFVDSIIAQNPTGDFIRKTVFCYSLSGVEIPLLTVTDFKDKEIPLN